MLFGYSLAINEYVDANRLEAADCGLLKVHCPACKQPVSVLEGNGHRSLAHVQPFFDDPAFRCDGPAADLTLEQREQENLLARNKRTEILRWDFLIPLLGKDPVANYEDDTEVILGKLRASGAMRWLSRWHLEMAADICGKTCNDQIEFRSEGERHLAILGTSNQIDIPASGYARQAHFQIGFDLLQSLLSRQEGADVDYDWLFVHAVKLCLPKWTAEARLDGAEGEEYPKDADTMEREKIAAARIIVGHFCDLLLDDRPKHIKAIETLAELEMKPPMTPIPMPLISYIGLDILHAMRATLFRLPYLAMLSEYDSEANPYESTFPHVFSATGTRQFGYSDVAP
jgi:hypothetical protein